MRAIITGANSGVGLATATALAAAGHHVTLACRNIDKAEAAATQIPGDVTVAHLDLAEQSSIRKFAESVDSVDVLVNNAGVLALPLTRTADGFEAHIGTNYLGHFSLTCLLADRITDRVVSVTSSSYRWAKLHLDDLNWERRRYSKASAYGESKLAVMLFTYQLARRGITAYSADPGTVNSSITRDSGAILRFAGDYINPIIGQTPADGARSTLLAITTDLPSGSYIAPRGPLHQWGRPTSAAPGAKARDAEAARRLWDAAAELTGCDLA